MKRRRLAFKLAAVFSALVVIVAGLVLIWPEDQHNLPPSPDPFSSDRSEGLAAKGTGGHRVSAGKQEGQPNIVVLMTDDLDLDTYRRTLPGTREVLRIGGTEFGNAVVSTPLCCPSRAAFLSGRYGHNNGILENNPGYPELQGKRDVLPVWLKRAGYRTAMVGKFMNGWERTAAGERGEPAPGWGEWVEMRRTYGYYDYELNLAGERRGFGSGREDYLTDVLSEEAAELISGGEGKQPLFLWMSWWAPHPELSRASGGECQGSAIPLERESGEFSTERLPGGEAIDEADISDKPAFLRKRRQLRPDDRRAARTSFRCRLASMEAVDRGVARIMSALDAIGELDNTAFIFTSDNGFFHLEHRLPHGKGLPYEEATRVPLLIDLPGSMGTQIARSQALISNIDLAPTILEIAAADPCRSAGNCSVLDGRSLTGALGGGRKGFKDRSLLIESTDGKPCGYEAVRSADSLYVEYDAVRGDPLCPPGQAEFYDLQADPDQLQNLLAGDRSVALTRRIGLATRELDRLRACAGTPTRPLGERRPCG